MPVTLNTHRPHVHHHGSVDPQRTRAGHGGDVQGAGDGQDGFDGVRTGPAATHFGANATNVVGVVTRSLQVDPVAAHAAITEDLFHGRVVEAEAFGANGNLGKLFKVKVYNEATGRVREALFKPREYGDRDGWCRPPAEYVAYELNRMLGMDAVPPVAYRRHIDVGFCHFDEGAFMYFVPDAHKLGKVDATQWGARKDLFLSDTRVLDVLLQNSDRHPGNFGRGRHWVDGGYRPCLIDQDASFRDGAYVTMNHDNAFLTGPTQVVRKGTLDCLRGLKFDWIKTKCGEFISDDEIRGILARRDGIVAYFDKLAGERGADQVIIDDNG